MDPETTKIDKIKLAICSLHFHDGYPSDQYPLPTELLSNKTPEQKIEFKGTKNNENCDSGINDQDIIETDEELETVKFSQLGKISNKMFSLAFFKKSKTNLGGLCSKFLSAQILFQNLNFHFVQIFHLFM